MSKSKTNSCRNQAGWPTVNLKFRYVNTHTHTVHWKVCVFISKKQCHVDHFDPSIWIGQASHSSQPILVPFLKLTAKAPENQWLEDWKMIHFLLGQQKAISRNFRY